MANLHRDISKIRSFVKKVAEYYHNEASKEDDRNYGCTWLFGGGELHAYCSNFNSHKRADYNANSNGNAFGETDGRWEGEALDRLRKRGWIFSKKLDICICPTCAKTNNLIKIK